MKAILLCKIFYYLENFELFDSPNILRSKILDFQKLICSFVNRNVSKNTFQNYLKPPKPSTNQHQKYSKSWKCTIIGDKLLSQLEGQRTFSVELNEPSNFCANAKHRGSGISANKNEHRKNPFCSTNQIVTSPLDFYHPSLFSFHIYRY